ncbi:MAG: nitrilase-related carbon-nitrogen hydrolase [Nocardioides sp.]|uniref:nitrilase-related carbon-nitrogen hydrolase n=1 Tax=Nocardioides sp. TaxID=35761 RepID=UPI0039E3DA96
MESDSLRVAAWQAAPGPLDVDGNLARLDAVAASAAARGAQVLVTPELFLTGYAIGHEDVRRLAVPADALPFLGPRGIAARHRVALVAGFPELAGDGPDAAVHNAAAVVAPDGALVAVHRKVHLWGSLDQAQFSANPLPPAGYELLGHRLGSLICYDVEFPEAVRRLAVQGAAVVLVPTANPLGCDEVQDVLLRARAVESGVGIVYANYAGSDTQLTYNGTSMVIAPDGTVLARASRDEEELLVADLPLGPDASRTGAGYLRDRRPGLY